MALAWEDLSAVARTKDQINPQYSDRLWQLFGPLIEAHQRNNTFVIAQLGQSLDGRIATPSGHSHYINGSDALDHLHRLRALVDAVVVGVGTVASDNPQLTVRRVTGDNPVPVIIDPNRRADKNAKIFAHPDHTPIIIGPRRNDDPPELICISPPQSGPIAPGWICDKLAERGLKRILVEGGATTVSRFLNAEVLDRLHILTGTVIIGSGPAGLDLPAIDHLRDAIRPKTRTFPFDDGDVLFDCEMCTGAAGEERANE